MGVAVKSEEMSLSPTRAVLRRPAVLGAGAVAAVVLAVGSTLTVGAAPGPAAVAVPDPAPTTVQVPEQFRTAPFDVPRTLTVPSGWTVSVHARIEKARFLATTPDGRLLVSQPSGGKVLLVTGAADEPGAVTEFLTGLRKPHDLVFATVDGTTWLYVAESHQVSRYRWTDGATTPGAAEVVVANLPDDSTGELKGAYAHALKNIAVSPDGGLYVSIASTCNACTSDTTSTPQRGAIYRYAADGTGGRLFARGLRNAEGLAFRPGTSELWAVVNNRDNLGYPEHGDITGDGEDDYGTVVPSYVDNHPPEEFVQVADGGFYGWPFCNPNPDAGIRDMPFDRDVQMNADGHVDCSTADRITIGMQAHSAPLGLTFPTGTLADLGAVVAFHGSWNRQSPTGYKVVRFPWDAAAGRLGDQQDLVTGFLSGGTAWGRPVDAAVSADGRLFVSDDQSGTVYTLTPTADAPPTAGAPVVRSLTLVNADTDQPVPGFDPIPDGGTIDLTRVGRRLNIRATVDGDPVGAVRFGLDGNAAYHTEHFAPYTLAGDADGGRDYLPWTPTAGRHVVRVTADRTSGDTGTAGSTFELSVTVTD